MIGRVMRANFRRSVRLVKGSHIIMRKFWDGGQAYLVQNHDKRVIFVNSYDGDRALIGATNIPFSGRAEDVAADEDEARYLMAHEWAETAEDILWRRSKLGLHMSEAERRGFAGWLAAR